MKFALAALVAAAPFAALGAQQVGYPPSSSPYHDLPFKHEITLEGGWFGGSTGSAGVGPQRGPLFGLGYGLHVGGPVEFTVHLTRIQSQRTVLNPALSGRSRIVGTSSFPLYLADIGLRLNLTGQKTFHGFMPDVDAGLGLASDGGAKRDVAGFRVGTPFALNFGAGLRYIAVRHVSLRAGVSDYLYQISYPSSYFLTPPTGSSILPPAASAKQWLHNAVFTLGVSYLIGR